MNDRDRNTIGYRNLRALVEDLLQPPATARTSATTAALQEHLRMHCRNCGEALDRPLREQGNAFCYACVDGAPRPVRGGSQ